MMNWKITGAKIAIKAETGCSARVPGDGLDYPDHRQNLGQVKIVDLISASGTVFWTKIPCKAFACTVVRRTMIL